MKLSYLCLVLGLLAIASVALAQPPPPPPLAMTPEAVALPVPAEGQMATSFKVPAISEKGVVLAAVRPMLEGIGCRVWWDSTKHEALASRGTTRIGLQPGHTTMTVDRASEASTVTLPLAPRYEQGVLIAPVQPLLHVFDASMTYEAASGLMPVPAVRPVPAGLSPGKSLQVAVNGTPVPLPSPPHFVAGHLVTPLRAVFSAMGAQVGWDAKLKQVVVRWAETLMRLTPGSVQAMVNHKPRPLSSERYTR